MNPLLKEIRHSPLLWMLIFVPLVLAVERIAPSAHTVLFVLAVLAIVPLAALLSHATESVAEKTGDAIGGLLNATLGNLTELIIALAALHAGEYMLVKASIAGAIVTNSLFMLGASFLLGGLRHHVQEYNRAGGRLYSALLLMATVALLAPAAVADLDLARGGVMAQKLSAGLAILLIVAYGLGLLFSLNTHKELFVSKGHSAVDGMSWPIGLAVGTLIVVTVLVTLVSEIFVGSVQKAGETLGLSPAFVGFIIVALVGAAAEMAVAFSAARKNRLDMSVSIALGSASQIALFVAPVLHRSQTDGFAVLAGCSDYDDDFRSHGLLHHKQRTLGMVHWRFACIYLRYLRHDALHAATGDLACSIDKLSRPFVRMSRTELAQLFGRAQKRSAEDLENHCCRPTEQQHAVHRSHWSEQTPARNGNDISVS